MKLAIVHIFQLLATLMIFIGVIFNSNVMIENGGKMPVYEERIQFTGRYHFSYSNQTEITYPILADNFPIAGRMVSLGDVLMIIGSVFLTITSIKLAWVLERWSL